MVVVQLVVYEPSTGGLASPFDKPVMVRLRTVDRGPAEHAARLESAFYFVHTLIVRRHPRGALLALEFVRLREVTRVHVLVGLNRVEQPTALHRAEIKDDLTDEEDDGVENE